jgi:hypothetical protein
MVEDGLLTRDDFADFAFRNPVRLHTAVQPGFFDGTAVADAARAVTAPEVTPRSAAARVVTVDTPRSAAAPDATGR